MLGDSLLGREFALRDGCPTRVCGVLFRVNLDPSWPVAYVRLNLSFVRGSVLVVVHEGEITHRQRSICCPAAAQLRCYIAREVRIRAPDSSDFVTTWSVELSVSVFYGAWERRGDDPESLQQRDGPTVTMGSWSCWTLAVGDAMRLAGTGGVCLGPVRSI